LLVLISCCSGGFQTEYVVVAAAVQENRCIKDLKDYLLGVCGDKDTKKKLRALLEEKASTVGLLVCRRFVNFPYEMVPKMYDSLFDEVSWATEDEVGFLSSTTICFCPFCAYGEF
jgi:hypothetical protein